MTEFKQESVHKIVAHSYMTFFGLFLLGISLDTVFQFGIFFTPVYTYLSWLFMIAGSLLIFWAQKTSRHYKKEGLTEDSFHKGPYKYSRSPTHWGLFLLMLGFGILAHGIFVILCGLISFLVSRLIYLKKEEDLLEVKYGVSYRNYRASVWL